MEKTPIERILAELAVQNISDAEFCRRLEASQQTLTNWKKRGLPGVKVPAVADVLGVTADWILTGRGPKCSDWMVERTPIERILAEISVQNLSEAEFCRRMGELQQTFSAWKKRGFPPAKAVKASDVLVVSVEWILAGREPKRPITESNFNHRRVPVLSCEQAGYAPEIAENYTSADHLETVGLDFDLAHRLSLRAFALLVIGDSMLPSFRQGDIVIIDPAESIRPGDIVAANFNNKPAILRRYRDRGEDANGNPVFELAPTNDAYPTLVVDSSRPGHIIGPVVEHRRKLR
ncbi:MAG TPA: S24 family peptidase [Gammaproteobacteria bacterium]